MIHHAGITAVDCGRCTVWYMKALRVGGTDNGAPGLPPTYHANSYGAFLGDPDGHNIEAVCHAPP